MSDYDRPSAPPHVLANALSDPIDLPPGRGRAAQSARVSAPGPSAAARAMCDSDLWPGAFDEAPEAERNVWLHRAAAALPILRAEVREETIRECLALAEALEDSYRNTKGRYPEATAYHDGGADAAEYIAEDLRDILDPDPTPPEVAP